MSNKAKKAPKNAKNKPKKAVKIPSPPDYFSGYSLKKWNELAPIFAEGICLVLPICQLLNCYVCIMGMLWTYIMQ